MLSLAATVMLAVTLTPAATLGGAAPEGQEPPASQLERGHILLKLNTVAKTDGDARASLAALGASDALGLTFNKRSVLGWIVADISATDAQGTQGAIAVLAADKAVVAVEPIGKKHALRAPNDPLLGELWGFAAIDVPTAWDTTVGNASERIGLIDSGINRNHIDLIEHDLGGFDFISDPANAADGNGRDSDYSDADTGGDFHGSHVAGTMVASADDNVGVPGINWNAGLITARALGSQGGTDLDIGEAALWLAGGHVDGVPDIGADKVSVINMSLGGSAPCSQFESDVYAAIAASGVTVVVATGNDGNDTPVGSPANCPGVIAVGASTPSFDLAFYSNFDSHVSIVAPGGDGSNQNDPSASVLSVDGSTDSGYVAFDGTSMATPHVTGVVSLMQAVNPRLSPSQIKNILEQSPFTCGGCNNVAFLDAPTAVTLAQQTTGELTGNEPAPGTSGDTAGNNSCGPNASPSADGQTCFCDPGFVVNAAQTACVAGGSSGNPGTTTGASCPAHAHDAGDGQNCLCDSGFIVNDAQTACVAEPSAGSGGGTVGGGSGNSGGSDCVNGICRGHTHSDDTQTIDNSGGCTAAGAPSSLALFAIVLLLGAKKKKNAKAV